MGGEMTGGRKDTRGKDCREERSTEKGQKEEVMEEGYNMRIKDRKQERLDEEGCFAI